MVTIVRDKTIPRETFFCGFWISSTAIEIDSKPKKPKNISEAPAIIPELPPYILPKPNGAKSDQFSGLMYQIPTKINKAKAENFNTTSIELKRTAAFEFKSTSPVTNTNTSMGKRSI